jgi:hypothetical protein
MPVWKTPIKHKASETMIRAGKLPISQSLKIVEALKLTPYHTMMTPKSRFKALGDIIPFKIGRLQIGMISIGDILIVVPLPVVLIYTLWT